MYKKPFHVYSLGNTIYAENNLKVPLLHEIGIFDDIHFHVVKWHKNFDALLGTHDLQKLCAKIDYQRNILEINNFEIPFFLEFADFKIEPQRVRINSSIKVPVSIEHGEIIFPETKFHENFTVPESIVNARNGYCILPAHESADIEVNFSERIPVTPFYESDISEPHLENNRSLKIADHIRTAHMNSEERQKILKLC
ncbi:hypothetical protein HHI36_008075, partial [Cryptolaemus montrouzieri]